MKPKLPLYLLFLFVLVCTMQSCSTSDSDLNPPGPGPGTDSTPTPNPAKRRQLLSADGSLSSNDNFSFYYDSTGRLIRIEFGYASGQIEVHYNTDTISHLIFPFRDINSSAMGAAAIFYYRPDKKIERVIYTPAVTQGTLNDAINSAKNAYYIGDYYGPVAGVDSIVYTSSGQLSEIWSLKPIPTFAHTIKFVYDNPTQISPSRIQQSENQGIRTSDIVLTTNNMESEAYKACWFLPFINELTIPHIYGGGALAITPDETSYLNSAWTLIPNCIIQYKETSAQSGLPLNYTSPLFTYEYSQDSLRFTGRRLVDDPIFPRFHYYFVLK